MPGVAERMLIRIDAQTGGAIREFRKVSKSADDMGKATGVAGKALRGLGLEGKVSAQALQAGVGVAAGTAAVALIQFGRQGVAAQRDLAEQVSASTVVFGKNASEIQDWAKSGASAFGQSARAALETANGFGTLFETLGVGPDLTARFSKGFTSLASDLASFKNTSVDDATQALRSGLVGEAEPLRKYGVLLNETAVKNKALQLGIGGTTGALSEQEKVFVRAQLILEQTAKAQGDFERTSGSLANQQRVLSAQMENLSANTGHLLLPAVTDVTKGLNVLASGAVTASQKTGELGDNLVSAFGGAIPGLGPLVNGLGSLGSTSKDAAESTAEVANAQQAAGQAAQQYAALMFSGSASSKELRTAQQGLAAASRKAAAEQKALADAMQSPEQRAKEQAAAVDSLRSALLNAQNAQKGIVDADRGVRDASERVSDARTRLSDVLKKGRVDTEAVSDAQYGLVQSSRDVVRAQEELASAQEKLNTLRRGGDPEERDDAERGVRGAQLELERARNRLNEAYRARNKARPKDIAGANLDIEDALLAVAEAEDNLQSAQGNLNEVTGQGAEGAKALSEAQRAVADAENRVEAAQRSRHDAQVALNKAQQGDLDLSRQIRDAKREVRDAEENLAAARDNAAKSRLDYADAQANENKLLQTGGAAASVLLGQLNALVSTYPQLHPILDDIIAKVTLAVTGGPRSSGPFGGPLHRRPELGDGMGESHLGRTWQSIIGAASGSGIPFSVSSTVRPGARTSTGNVSLHALGKAVDFGGTAANLSALFDYFSGDPGVREMFYSPKGYGLIRGRRVPNASLGGSIVRDHYNHVHVGVYHGGGEFRAPTPGGEGLAILRDREVVLTPEQARAGGGISITVNAGWGANGPEIAEQIARLLQQYKRRGGQGPWAN